MRILLVMLLMSCHVVFSQDKALGVNYKELWFLKHLNKDGSFGEKNKQIITSLVLLTLLEHGETTDSAVYGKVVKDAILFIQTESSKEGPLLNSAFMLNALHRAYEMIGADSLKAPIVKLKLDIISKVKTDHWESKDNKLLLNLMCAESLSPKYSLNSSSTNKVFSKVLLWFSKQNGEGALFSHLYLKHLASQNNEDTSRAAKQLKLGKKLSSFLEHYLITKSCFAVGGLTWRDWNRYSQKTLLGLQEPDGSWPGEPSPGFLKESKLDDMMFNSCMASLSLTVYYRYLPSSKGAVYGGRTASGMAAKMASYGPPYSQNNERYQSIKENGVRSPLKSPLSTFSVDVDTASYSNVRRYLSSGNIPPVDSVRIEEMINYFAYERTGDTEGIFDIGFEMAPCPWNKNDMLLKTTLSTEEIEFDELSPKNLVFLVDVSGSMSSRDKLPLLKKSLSLLVLELKKEDRISLVTYAGNESVVLNAVSGDKHFEIVKAIEQMESGGGTNGSSGIEKAYEIAKANFIKDGINRVLLCTDGDFNVGISDHASLMKFISKKAKSNVFLTVMGFGTGNLRDDIIEQLADKGNGQAFYIDNLLEAKKALVDEMGATFNTVAKDTKLQIEFNPAVVSSYRLIGYENRILSTEDFADDKVDAGELGSGHQVTALYQINLRKKPIKEDLVGEPLKYQDLRILNIPEMLTYKVRYKKPSEEKSEYFERAFSGEVSSKPSVDWSMCASIALQGMLLRQSQYLGLGTFDMAKDLCSKGIGVDKLGYRKEFLNLVENASKLQSLMVSEKEKQKVEAGIDLVD